MWLDPKQTRKWKANSVEARIYAAAEAEALANGYSDAEAAGEGLEAILRVMSWMKTRDGKVVVEMIKEAWGVDTSQAALSGFWQRFVDPFLSEQMRRASTGAARISGDLDTAGVTASTRDLIAQMAFDIMTSPDPDAAAVVKLSRLLLDHRKADQDERKIALLEEKAAQLDKAKDVMGSQLPMEEQNRRLKEILK
jgi:hypothetical protein